MEDKNKEDNKIAKPKKDPHGNPTRRALGIYALLLFSDRMYSLSELASKFDCSKQTIIHTMRHIGLARGIHIEEILQDGRRWYKVKTPRKRPNVSVTTDELQRLVMCRDMLCNLLPKSYKDDITTTLLHATTLLDDQDQRSSAFQAIAQSAVKGGIDYTPFQGLLKKIEDAINKRKVCQIEYKAPHHKNSKTYHFVPIRLIPFRETLYVRGFEVESRGSVEPIRVMTFPLHRFRDVQLTPRDMPEKTANAYKVELEDTGAFGIINKAPFTVEVRFTTPTASEYARERTWSPDQVITPAEDGTCTLRFTAQSEIEVVKWVLGFGADAELLAPENLRQKVIDEHRAALGRYETSPAKAIS